MPSGNGYMLHSGGFEDDTDSCSPSSNPFAGHTEPPFSSAIRPNETRVVTRPALRQRVSSVSGKAAKHSPVRKDEHSAKGSPRSRFRTNSGVSNTRSGSDHHPLARYPRSSRSSGSINSLDNTRPRLQRLLGDWGTTPSHPEEEDTKDSDTEHPPSNESGSQRVVIVHQVSPADSLAGVALKYGVSLADLRRANQMWASDTIHLRKDLYIPLDKTQKSKQLNLALLEVAAEQTASSSSLPNSESSSSTHTPSRTSSTGGDSAQRNLTIRRVPASQLSFFPPPSSGTSMGAPPSTQTMPKSPNGHSRRDAIPSDFFSSSSSSRLTERLGLPISTQSFTQPIRSQITSLFNALPIAPSTRDTLMARLSQDSRASTPTQGSEEQQHEMDDVSSSSLKSGHSPDARERRIFLEARPSKKPAGSADAEGARGGFELHQMSPPKTPISHRRQRTSSTQGLGSDATPSKRGHTSKPYTSPEHGAEGLDVVRTAQLEPSPSMQLPIKVRKSRDENT